ncbi:hypothetical protein [Ferrovum myxofaciens]|uniref:hypothetical protein n=1 Tax=Ferrovum myxofaciens TaxID=416213 RepID=UPI003EB8126C
MPSASALFIPALNDGAFRAVRVTGKGGLWKVMAQTLKKASSVESVGNCNWFST